MHRRHAPPHRQESLAARDDAIDVTGLATSNSAGDAQLSELCPEIQDQVSDPQSGLVWYISSGVDGLFAQTILPPPLGGDHLGMLS